MKVLDTTIPEVKIIQPDLHYDERGYFYESYNERNFSKLVCSTSFVQDNQSKSKKGVIRGMHWQLLHMHKQNLYGVSEVRYLM